MNSSPEKMVVVGKFTLESLTTGMYSDSKIVFREYIQNAVDSIEEAIKQNLITRELMRIDIDINDEKSCISIFDNGTGICSKHAGSTLLSVGTSNKRHTKNRGFRGIGRLGGLSYCNTLKFTTTAAGERIATRVTFDCQLLKKLLVPGNEEHLTMEEVLNQVSKVDTFSTNIDDHYMLVELIDVDEKAQLLDYEEVLTYLSQVSPVPYNIRQFIHGDVVKRYMQEKGFEISEFPIFISSNGANHQLIMKPNRHRFDSGRGKESERDSISKIEYFEIYDKDNKILSIGWYGVTSFNGVISLKEIRGLRMRKGNILIGNGQTLNHIFKQDRFNSWVQGEIFIFSDDIIPNARRDDFEYNKSYVEFLEQLKSIGEKISSLCIEASRVRNDPYEKIVKKSEQTIVDVEKKTSEGFNSRYEKDKLVDALNSQKDDIKKLVLKPNKNPEKIQNIIDKINLTLEEVEECKHFKADNLNSSYSKREKKVLYIVNEVLSLYLEQELLEIIVEDIINSLNKKE